MIDFRELYICVPSISVDEAQILFRERFVLAMKDEKKKKKTVEVDFPRVTEIDIPDPPVPNRAHTELVLGSDGRSGISDSTGRQ